MISKLLYTLIFLLIINVNPEFTSCSQTCDNAKDEKLITFDKGKTYIYNFDAETSLNIKSIDIKVGIKSRVEISSQTECDLTLYLRNVQLIGVTNYQNDLKQQLESYPIVFGFDGGKVGTVCASEYDESWVINLKKSIISGFQVSTNSSTTKLVLHENDIFGDCETIYEPKNSLSGTILMEKTKSLNNCEYKTEFGTQTLISLDELLLKKAPLMESFVICSHIINNGLLKDVTCKEQQLFLPLLLTVNKPIVFSTLSLSLVQQIVGLLPKNKRLNNFTKIKQELAMVMNDKTAPIYTDSHVFNLLTSLCSQLFTNNITSETVELFSELVTAMRSISPLIIQRWMSGDEWIKNPMRCQTTKLWDLFIDASVLASSEGSIKVLLNSYYNQEITGLRASYLLSLLSFSSKPDENALKLLIPLLDSNNVGRQEILAISSFINNLCKDNIRCDNMDEIRLIVNALINKLYSQNNINTIAIIQAIDNINAKYLNTAKKHIIDISIKRTYDDGVRVAAISVLTKLSDEKTRETLLKIFYDEMESIEVRIAAYKAIVMSGNVSSFHLQKISHVNHHYLVNYVRSHIKNLKETLNPMKKRILPENMPIFVEPDNNYFGTSRNIEMSYFFGKTNLGVSFEADIIYSNITRFPCSIRIMISFPINGYEFQAIEITIRQKILETYLQEIIFKSENNIKLMMEKILELFENKALIQRPEIFAQLFVKLNGKNILALDTKDLNSINFNLFKQYLLNLSQNVAIDRAFGTHYFDTNIKLPTITGFPLIINLNGSLLSAIQTIIGSKNILSNNLSLFNIQIMPSFLIELSSGMHYEAVNWRPGINFITNIASTTGIKFDVKNRDEYTQELIINLPKDKQSLIKFEAKVESRDSEGRISRIDSYTQTNIKSCVRTFHNLLGISYCNSLSLPHSDITTGIISSEIYLEKSDKSMDSLVFIFEWPRNPNGDTQLWQLIIEKPNSFINRRSYANLELTKSRDGIPKEIRLEMQTRDMQIMIATTVRHDSNQYILLTEMVTNGEQMLILDATLKNQTNDRTIGYMSKLKLVCSLTEEINFYANFKLTNDSPIINALLNYFHFSSELTLHFPKFEIITKAIVYNSEKHKWSNISIEYKWLNMRKELIKIDTKFDHLLPEDLPNVSFYGSVESTQFPNYCAEIIYSLKGNWSLFMQTYMKLAWNKNLTDSIFLTGTYIKENKSLTENIDRLDHTIWIKIKSYNIIYEIYKRLEIRTEENESIKVYFKVNGSDRTSNGKTDFSAKIILKNSGIIKGKCSDFLRQFCNGYANASLIVMNKDIKFSQQWNRLSENKNRSLRTSIEWDVKKYAIFDMIYDEPVKSYDKNDENVLIVMFNPEIGFKTHLNVQRILMNGNITIEWKRNQNQIYMQFENKSTKKQEIKGIFLSSINGINGRLVRITKLELTVPNHLHIQLLESNENIYKQFKSELWVQLIVNHFGINYEFVQKYLMLFDDKSDAKKHIEYYNALIDRENRRHLPSNLTTRIEYKTLPEYGTVEQLSAFQIKITIEDREYLYRDEVWQTDSDHYNSVISLKSTKNELLVALEQNYHFNIVDSDKVKHEIYTYMRITDVIDLISHASLYESKQDNNKIEKQHLNELNVQNRQFESIFIPKFLKLYNIIDQKLMGNMSRITSGNHIFDIFIPKTKLSHITNITIISDAINEIIVQSFTQNTNNPDLYIIDAWISQNKSPHILIQIPYYFDATLKKTMKSANILPKTVLKFNGSADSIPYNHVSEYQQNDDSFSLISQTDRIISEQNTIDDSNNFGSAYYQRLIQPTFKYETLMIANFDYQPMKKANLEFKTQPYCQQSSLLYNSTSVDLLFSATVYGKQILNISSQNNNSRKFC